MIDTQQLHSIATKLIPDFIGVYAIDDLPKTNKHGDYSLIVNTDTQNLPGTHWLAVIVRSDKEGYVFDSFGGPPPLQLQNWLNQHCANWSTNLRQVQSVDSNLCGYYCIYFLWFATSNHLRNEHFKNIMNLLFPNLSMYTYYDALVQDFVKILNI